MPGEVAPALVDEAPEEGVISGAALIMASVFLALLLSSAVVVKMLALGLEAGHPLRQPGPVGPVSRTRC